MAQKSMIIIGGGLAGLSTGVYGQLNGYATHIFEQHTLPGGVCTAWKRKGYTMDGCIHWLMGSRPESSMYRIYEEVGALEGNRLMILEEYGRCLDLAAEKELVFSADLNRLARDMKALTSYPEDHTAIDTLITAAEAFKGFDMQLDKAPELIGPLDNLKMMWKLRHLGKYVRYQKIPVKDFAAQLKDPFLRWVITGVFVPEMPMMFLFALLGQLAAGDLSVVEGGSLKFSLAIAQRYKDLGGKVTYGAEVAKILVENDRAVGIQLSDGSEHRADIVVSAADGRSTIFGMLEGKYVDDKIRHRYDHWPIFPPLILATFGVAREFPGEVADSNIKLHKPISIGGKEIDVLMVRIFNYDPTLAPPGKTTVQVMLTHEFDYWDALQKDRARYDAEKEKVAALLLQQLEGLYPGITQNVEVTDVATPYTFWRYSRNYRGAFEGWLMSTETQARVDKTLPGLANFYMVGQWVEPGGGVPTAIASGRNLIQILCHQEKRAFKTTR